MGVHAPSKHAARAVWCVAIALAVALVAGGCTSRQSDEQYTDRLAAAVEVRTSVGQRIKQQSFSGEQEYDTAAKDVQRVLEELDSDPPPKSVAAAHDRMVDGLDSLATLLTRLKRCERLGAVDPQAETGCRDGIDQQVYDDVRNDFREADTIYRSEGFDVEGLVGGDGAADGSEEDVL